MDDICKILQIRDNLNLKLEQRRKQYMEEVHNLLFGASAPPATATIFNSTDQINSPEPTNKRLKRLSSLNENEEEAVVVSVTDNPLRNIVCASNSELFRATDSSEAHNECVINKTSALMPPPPVPIVSKSESSLVRPQRAAKLKSEKNLKEPALKTKLRQPGKSDEVKIKLEDGERASQYEFVKNQSENSIPLSTDKSINLHVNKTSLSTVTSNNVDPTTIGKINVLNSDSVDSKKLRVKIKREKVSISSVEEPLHTAPLINKDGGDKVCKTSSILPEFLAIKKEIVTGNETTLSTSVDAASTKKNRKKKEKAHKPIKVERFSDIDKVSPISSRTRKGSTGKQPSQESQKQHSIYEDAVENLLLNEVEYANGAPKYLESKVAGSKVNETVIVPNATLPTAPAFDDATFQINALPNSNCTVTNANYNDAPDSTFNLAKALSNSSIGRQRSISSNRSMETAKDSTPPQCHDCLITENDSLEQTENFLSDVHKKSTAPNKILLIPNVAPSAESNKMSIRTHELFNPLVQSPVKIRVAAFENAVQAAIEEPRKNTRSKRTKENTSGIGNSTTTPVIGKLGAPSLGRFLTPTQSTNIPSYSSAQPKKAPMSASKATSLVKLASSNLKASNSVSSKALSRENSGDDFRKGLHQLAEERKKQREQKHLLAAQQREAKERERAERMAKLAKEREEKRLKKQQEQEQKKREIEEFNRKLRQQEEAETMKKTKSKCIQDQERELLIQMKQQQAKQKLMMPPPTKAQTKYVFEMLHEDDSTDDEGKVSYKRPPPPLWSRNHIRGAAIHMQQYCPTDVIDSFFSVEPTTPDLKIIFPNIDPRYLKRNSSVLWNTPPRYSELPKY